MLGIQTAHIHIDSDIRCSCIIIHMYHSIYDWLLKSPLEYPLPPISYFPPSIKCSLSIFLSPLSDLPTTLKHLMVHLPMWALSLPQTILIYWGIVLRNLVKQILRQDQACSENHGGAVPTLPSEHTF